MVTSDLSAEGGGRNFTLRDQFSITLSSSLKVLLSQPKQTPVKKALFKNGAEVNFNLIWILQIESFSCLVLKPDSKNLLKRPSLHSTTAFIFPAWGRRETAEEKDEEKKKASSVKNKLRLKLPRGVVLSGGSCHSTAGNLNHWQSPLLLQIVHRDTDFKAWYWRLSLQQTQWTDACWEVKPQSSKNSPAVGYQRQDRAPAIRKTAEGDGWRRSTASLLALLSRSDVIV